MAEYDRNSECPECGEEAPKVPSVTNHSFAHTPVGGARPQNTGVHSIDYSFDQVIGRDAERKWKTIQDRQKRKRDVIAGTPGATGHDLSRTADGDYRVMPSAERQAKEAARSAGTKAVAASSSTPKSEGA